jgi:carboxypeptidase Q
MRLSLLSPLLLFSLAAFAQESSSVPKPDTLADAPAMPVSAETKTIVQRIIGDTIVGGQAYEYDRQLADEIGPRLTGSPNYLKAVKWGEAKFKELGLTNVHTESFKSDTWDPEAGATGRITSPVDHTLHLWSYGWSPSTPKKGISGEVVYLPSVTADALKKMGSQITGKIVFFNRDSLPKPFSLKQFIDAGAALEALHPAAMLTTGGKDGTESMGGMTFDGTLSGYPIAQIGAEDALLLKRLVDKGSVRVEFEFTNRTKKSVDVPEVIGEIRGSEKPDEVVIVGGHLDSWNPGTGAQDNGTGAATTVDAARELMSLGKAPKRTVRFILFGGEEQGLLGSTAYAKAHAAEMSRIDAVLVTDTGGETAKGWYLMGRSDEKTALANIKPLLSGLGSDDTSEDNEFIFETDHAGFDVQGVPSLVLWTDVTKYFTLHHKASDTFDAVNKATLLQGAATVIATTYAIADSAAPFAPHLTPAQVESTLKDAKQWDDYKALKGAGMLP